MSFLKDFKEFAVKGNVVDMAVGVVIGTAFGKIVSSLVTDVIMPPLGYVTGGIDFTKRSVVLPALQAGQEPVTVRYGAFIQTIFDFVIIALAIFVAVRVLNRLKHKEPPPAAAPVRQEVLLEEIRDLLKKQSN